MTDGKNSAPCGCGRPRAADSVIQDADDAVSEWGPGHSTYPTLPTNVCLGEGYCDGKPAPSARWASAHRAADVVEAANVSKRPDPSDVAWIRKMMAENPEMEWPIDAATFAIRTLLAELDALEAVLRTEHERHGKAVLGHGADVPGEVGKPWPERDDG